MMTDRERSFAVLLALFDLARAGLPGSPERVAGRLAMHVDTIDAALDRLARSGLVRGARLTLTGLAVASSLDRARSSIAIAIAA